MNNFDSLAFLAVIIPIAGTLFVGVWYIINYHSEWKKRKVDHFVEGHKK